LAGFESSRRTARTGEASAVELQGQGDEFIVAFRHVVQHQVFQDAQAPVADDLVAVQRLAVGRVNAGGVNADQLHPRSARRVTVSGA
jgi:hypothetical protein